jgi:uncharacterized cupin superfamily protein
LTESTEKQSNVFTAHFEYDHAAPAGFRAGFATVGAHAGGKDIVVKAIEIPAGETVCPYHYVYDEAWLIIMQGELVLRNPHGARTVVPGDVICYPAGPAGAHQLSNRSKEKGIAIWLSHNRQPQVAVYPDSSKMAIEAGEDNLIVRQSDGVDYWDGEA